MGEGGWQVMCIICNCNKAGDTFLHEHFVAARSMKNAAAAMLICSQTSNSKFEPDRAAENRKRYDKTHKKMVKLIRAWNRLEQEREC